MTAWFVNSAQSYTWMDNVWGMASKIADWKQNVIWCFKSVNDLHNSYVL